jgi:hypothetical protein
MEKVFLAVWDSYSSAALFHVAYIAYLAGLSLPQALRAAFLPILGDARNEPDKTLAEVRRARRLSNLLIPPGLILGAIIVWLLLPMAFPEQYNDGSLGMSAFEIFLLLLTGWAFTMLAAPTYVEVCAGQRPWMFTLMLAEAAGVAVLAAVLTIPAWGLMGAVFSSIIASLALLAASILHSRTGLDGGIYPWLFNAGGIFFAVYIPYLGISENLPLIPCLLVGIILCFTPWYTAWPWGPTSAEAE